MNVPIRSLTTVRFTPAFWIPTLMVALMNLIPNGQKPYSSPWESLKEEQGVLVAVTEYGLVRWAPGGQEFIQDAIRIFEDLALNHAVWQQEVSWEPYAEEVHAFNYRLGDDRSNREYIVSTALLSVLYDSWRLNRVRPSSIAP